MSVLAAASVSCTKTGPENDNTGTPEGCPVTYVRFPAQTIYSGDRIPVLGSGFSAGTVFYLVSDSGTGVQTEITGVTVTASGIEMTVNVRAGEYMFVIEQDGRWELGLITVAARPIDVTVSGVPQYCLPGGSITVTGLGFSATAVLALENPETGERTLLDTEAGQDRLTAAVPENAPKGKSSLVIVQDNGEMTVSRSFFVTTEKYLTGIKFSIGSGESAYTREINVSRDGAGNITACTEYGISIVPGSDASHGEYSAYTFSATPEAEENYGYTDYMFKVDGSRVLSYTIEFERQDETGGIYCESREIDWEYDRAGYLVYYGQGTSELVQEDGNLNQGGMYVYEEADLVNNPFAADFTLTSLASNDIQILIAQIFGFTGTKSANLPSGRLGGENSEASEIAYVFDEEGYLTSASFREGIMPVTIEYRYE